MTTTALAPNADVTNTGWTLTGGASLQAVWSDGSDSTYAQSNLVSIVLGETDCTTFSLGSTEWVKDIYLVVRAAALNANGLNNILSKLGTLDRNGQGQYIYFPRRSNAVYSSSVADYTVIGFGACFDGFMTQAQIDALRLNLEIDQGGFVSVSDQQLRVHKVTINVISQLYPTASAVTFSGLGTRPFISWTEANVDATGRYYRVKVFKQSDTTASSFNADTATAAWDSGDVYFSGFSQPTVQVGTDLLPSTPYVAYLKVGTQTGWTLSASSPTVSGVNPGFLNVAAQGFGSSSVIPASTGTPGIGPITPPRVATNNIWYITATAYTVVQIAPAKPTITLTDEPNNVVGGPRVKIDVVTQDNILKRHEAYEFYFPTINGPPWYPFDANTKVDRAAVGAPLIGTNIMRVTRLTSIGDAVVSTVYAGATVNGLASTFGAFVTAGRTYAIVAQVKSPVTARTARAEIDWFNSSGTFISTSTLGSITTSTSAWKAVAASVVAPANSVFARINLRVLACAINEETYWSVICLRPYDNGDTISTDGVVHQSGAGYCGTGNKLSLAMWNEENLTGSVGYINGIVRGQPGETSPSVSNLIVATARLGTRVLQSAAVGTIYPAASYIEFQYVGDISNNEQLFKWWPLLPVVNQTIKFSVWASPPVTTQSVFCMIEFYDANRVLLGTVVGTPVSCTSAGFSNVSVSVPTASIPVGATQYLPLVAHVQTAASQQMNFDTLSLTTELTTIDSRGDILETNAGFTPLNMDSGDRYVTVERSTDGGVTWTFVRYSNVTPSGSSEPQTATVYDYEIIAGITYQYRTRVIGYHKTIAFPGAYNTASITPALTTSGTTPLRWWIKDPFTPANSMQVDILEDSLKHSVTEAQAMYDPLGRTRNIVVADVVYGEDFSFTFDFISTSEYNAFRTLHRTQRTFLLQRQWASQQWYIRFRDKLDIAEFNSTPIRYLINSQAIEVDVP